MFILDAFADLNYVTKLKINITQKAKQIHSAIDPKKSPWHLLTYSPKISCVTAHIPISLDHVLSSLRLSSAGFSYGGKGDIVTCSACGLKEGNWNGIEAPLLVHARKSPSCPLIQSLRKPDSYDDMKSGSKCSEDVEQFEAPTSDKCENQPTLETFY
ncbi:unnamed protein product [Mytilus edulis]|uniref:BIRC2_3 n=1 Tax=Mytilus edulis TaxID=6550 RepID=A0A8S3VJ99_MYTED|nr:unnamed protein product [Mytilus edulis]